ncbi:MAG: amidohydrolase family protein [Chloroflexi bacterium]|nr:amidohydrolase family protein [Chloroflexota bacterium]
MPMPFAPRNAMGRPPSLDPAPDDSYNRPIAHRETPMGRTIFADANLIDGEHPPQKNTTVVVEGERISRIAPRGEKVPSLPGDVRFDLGGKSLMPGMVMAHFHPTYQHAGTWGGPVDLQHPPAYLAMVAAKNVHELLMCGYTSYIGASTVHNIDAVLKKAIADKLIQGPRIVAASRDVVTTGGVVDNVPHWWEVGLEGIAFRCDGPDAFRRGVREEIKRGADIIKLYVTWGHGVPGDSEQMAISQDELQAAADAAHERGKLIRGHVVSKKGIMACLKARVDLLDHADAIDGEAIEGILKNKAYVAPSIFYPSRLLEEAKRRGEADQLRWRIVADEFEKTCAMLPEATAAGVKMVVGDDYGTVALPHGSYARELEIYVKRAGIAPLDVIRWATKNGAELMGLGSDLGTVAPGKFADLLVMDGDPTADIAVLQDKNRIKAVMKGGQFEKKAL